MKIIAIIMMLVLVTGCWDRKELSQIGMVAAMAIDKDPKTGEFVVTSQFLRPASESTQTPTPDRPFIMVSSKGKTVYEAIRRANQTVDRKGFFAHTNVVIISEQLAKEGLFELIDSFPRGKEIRGYVWLSIAKDAEAKKILESRSNNIARIPAHYLKGLFDNAEHNASSINMHNFYRKALGEGINPVAGVLTLEKTENKPLERVKLSGGAAFKKDKFVGFLNEKETRGYNWITGEINTTRGTLILPSIIEDGKFVTILMQELKTKIKSKTEKNGQFSFAIEVKQKGKLVEQQATGKFEDRKQIVDYLSEIEQENEKVIEDEIRVIVEKAQQDFKADIFGFGKVLSKKHPNQWNKRKDHWDETFTHAPYTVKVDVDIESSGLMQGPFQPEN